MTKPLRIVAHEAAETHELRFRGPPLAPAAGDVCGGGLPDAGKGRGHREGLAQPSLLTIRYSVLATRCSPVTHAAFGLLELFGCLDRLRAKTIRALEQTAVAVGQSIAVMNRLALGQRDVPVPHGDEVRASARDEAPDHNRALLLGEIGYLPCVNSRSRRQGSNASHLACQSAIGH